MFLKVVLLAFVVGCLQLSYSAVPIIKKCKIEDAKCIKASAQAMLPTFAAGIPELGVETLDPLKIKNIDASSSSLTLKLTNGVLTGLSQCIVKKTQFNDEKTKIIIKFLCTVEANAQYEMLGKLLVFSMEGKGDAYVALRKILITVEADIKEVNGADGETHWSIPTWKHSYELKDKSTLKFENLFSKNEILGRVAMDVIDANPNELIVELGDPIVQAVAEIIVKNINNFFIQTPISSMVE